MKIEFENTMMKICTELKFDSVRQLFYYIDSTLMDKNIYADDYTMCGESINVKLEDGRSFLVDPSNVTDINDNRVTYIICK